MKKIIIYSVISFLNILMWFFIYLDINKHPKVFISCQEIGKKSWAKGCN